MLGKLDLGLSLGVPSLGVYSDQGLVVDKGDYTVVYDAALARLHRTGRAQELPIYGHSPPEGWCYTFDPSSGAMLPAAPLQLLDPENQ